MSGTFAVLHSFVGGSSDGAAPQSGLIRDKNGNLYGTTVYGGSSNFGVVFRVATNGRFTVLHSFAGSDGGYPQHGSLLMDTKGNLYGTNQQGGAAGNCGVVYKLSKSGTLTVLHSFAGGTTDGCGAVGTPAMDRLGSLYGTTFEGGASNEGIVWKVSKRGTETVLHSFAGGTTDGGHPYAGVIRDAKGNLYGDTFEGGATGVGTVYELSKGTLTLLHSFAGSDGAYPVGGVIRDAQGNLYGTTYQGGSSASGTVWKLTP